MNHVLIADDEPITLRLLEMSVAQAGNHCSLFTNGPDVIDNAEEIDPDLAILDYQLPGCSGLELIEKFFKQSEKLQGKPIIVVTGYRELALKESLINAGADDVILKPFSPRLLGQRVNELIETKKAG